MYQLVEIREFLKLVNVYTILTNDNTREKFLQLYGYTFDEYPSCTGCADEIEQAINKFMWIIKHHEKQNKTTLMKATSVSKYTMKDKVRIYSSSLNMMVTKYNCTDAIAEVLIKENPKCKDSFILNQTEESKAIETYSVVNPIDEVIDIPNKEVVSKKKGRKKIA